MGLVAEVVVGLPSGLCAFVVSRRWVHEVFCWLRCRAAVRAAAPKAMSRAAAATSHQGLSGRPVPASPEFCGVGAARTGCVEGLAGGAELLSTLR